MIPHMHAQNNTTVVVNSPHPQQHNSPQQQQQQYYSRVDIERAPLLRGGVSDHDIDHEQRRADAAELEAFRRAKGAGGNIQQAPPTYK